MKLRIRLAVLAATLAGPAFAQDAQMPLSLEQQLGAVAHVEIATPVSSALASRDHALQAGLERDVSARVAAALTPPARLGAVVARRANATEPSSRSARRVLYAAK